MYNIIIIDSQKLLTDLLSDALSSDGNFNVVATDIDTKNSVSLCEKFKPDLILMDICPENNSNGLVYAKKIKELYPNIKIILMSGVPSSRFINEAKRTKVESFVFKNISKDSLVITIQNTLDGYSMYPSKNVKNNVPNIVANLTNTELKILTSYCRLLDRNKVANELGISLRNLNNRVSSIYEKTGYKDLTKLSIYCVVNGLIFPNIEIQSK